MIHVTGTQETDTTYIVECPHCLEENEWSMPDNSELIKCDCDNCHHTYIVDQILDYYGNPSNNTAAN